MSGDHPAFPIAVHRDGVPALRPSPTTLAAILQESRQPATVAAAVAALKADLERVLADDPFDYESLVQLGELDLRIGMSPTAQALLYRATLLPPPSWEAYQRTSLLLRRAEAQAQHAFDRAGGAPPPFVGALRWLATALRSALHVDRSARGGHP